MRISERIVLSAIVAVLLGVFGLTGFLYFRYHFEKVREQLTTELTNVVDLKTSQIVAWRRERLGDAETLMHIPRIAESAGRISRTGGVPAVGTLYEEFLERFRTTYGYEAVFMYDSELKPLLASPAGGALSVEEHNLLFKDIKGTHDVVLHDLYRRSDGAVRMALVVPLWRMGNGGFRGAVVVRIDPRKQLYPLVSQWPKPSETADTILVRREGTSILFLSNPRHRPDAALSMRLPLERRDYLVSKVVASGAAALQGGVDYRGEPVLAVANRVPDSPWVMIVEVAQSEVYGPLKREIMRTSVFFVLVLVSGGIVLGEYLRRRRRRMEDAYLESERRRKAALERAGLMLRYANDGILLLDDALKIVDVNERAANLYGYAPEEMLGMSVAALQDSGEATWTITDPASEKGCLFEAKHRRKDGFVFAVEVSAKPAEVEGRRLTLAIIRDIRERKAHEWEIQRLSRMYLVISRINQAMLHKKSSAELFDEICRTLVEHGRFRFAWIGVHDPETRRIMPISSAGADDGYIHTLAVSSDPELPEGRGPSGVAFRENRAVVCNDYQNDPLTILWQARLRERGVQSAVAIPLRRDGRPIGQLAVYSEDKNCFGVQEISLLEEAVENVSFALGVFAADEQRRAAEAAQRESETRLQFVLTTTPAVIYSFQATGEAKVLFISRNVYDVLGYEPECFTRDREFWMSHLHPDDHRQMNQDLVALSSFGAIVREYRFLHADGQYRWMYDEMRLVRDDRGDPMEFVGYWFDNTARKEAEEALKEREEIFSTIVGQAMDAIVLIDAETGRFSEFNTAAHESLGYGREEFGAFTLKNIVADAVETEYLSDVERLRREGGITFETRHRHHGGWFRDVRVSARVIVIRGRDYVATVWGDITESKRLALEHHEQGRRLAALMGNLPGMAYRCRFDENWTMEVVSAGALALTGYTPEELIGNKTVAFGHLIHPDDRKVVWERVKAAIEMRSQFQLNYRIATRDGEERWMWERGVGVYDEQGGLVAVEGFVMDVTERQQFEIELHELVKELRAYHAVSTAIDQHGVGLRDLLEAVVRQLPGAMKRPAEAQVEIELRGHLVRAGVEGGMAEAETTVPVTVNGQDAGRITMRYVGAPEGVEVSLQEREMMEGIARTLGIGVGERESFEHMRRSEARFRAIFDHADVGMFETTADGRITRANTFLGTLLGAGPESLAGRHWAEFSVSPEFGRTSGAPPTTPREVRCVRVDGTEFWGLLHGTLEAGSGGHPKGYICLLQDISAQVEARDTLMRFNAELEEKVIRRTQELAARNREVQALLQAIPDMVMLMEADGRVLHFQNAQGTSGLALLMEQARPDGERRLPKKLEAPCVEAGRKALQTNVTVIAEARIENDSGMVFIEIRTAPIGADSFVAFVRDITERKRLEAETAAMLEKERQISEMKTRFISVTSHEFRTPMAAALGSADLLKNHMDRLGPEKRAELINRIQTSMHRMTDMLDDVLTLNRMDAKRQEVKPEELDLVAFSKAVVEEVRLGDFGAHEIECEASTTTIEARTDASMLHSILSNLLSNAVRYSQAGQPVTVRVSAEAGWVTLAVEDKGIGVPEADRERIFEPFERGSNVGTIRGTGIGLNIVKRMTELLGGTIRIENVEGGGTRFVIVLPRDSGPLAAL